MEKMSSKGRCESDAEDYAFNVVLIGATKVGKTSFCLKSGTFGVHTHVSSINSKVQNSRSHLFNTFEFRTRNMYLYSTSLSLVTHLLIHTLTQAITHTYATSNHRAEDVEGEEYAHWVKNIDTNRPVILKLFDTERAEELLEKAHVVICVADITDSDGCDTYLRSYWHEIAKSWYDTTRLLHADQTNI